MTLSTSRIAEIQAGRVPLNKVSAQPSGLFVVTAVHNFDSANDGHAWMVVTTDPAKAVSKRTWQGGHYAATAYPVLTREEGEAFIEHLRDREWDAEQRRNGEPESRFTSHRYAAALPLLLLALALTGCGQTANSHESQIQTISTTPEWVSRAVRLLPEAETAVFELTGVRVTPTLRTDKKLTLPGTVAQREGTELWLTAAGAATDRDCYDTLCHELLHVVTNAQTTGSVDDVDTLRLQASCNELISWRFAAELTAAKYGGEPKYDWRYIPRCDVPGPLMVDLVLSRPEVVMDMARNRDTARSFLTGVRRGLAE